MKKIFLLLMIVTGPCFAGLSEGDKALKAGDFALALKVFTPLAEAGDANAQIGLGTLYENGLGVPKRPAAAMSWYQKAADQGNAKGQFSVGRLYATDSGFLSGVQRSYTLAASWYLKAANQGLPEAQGALGSLYEHGTLHEYGTSVKDREGDYAQAVLWYRKAADQGNGVAKSRLTTLEAKTAQKAAKIKADEKFATDHAPLVQLAESGDANARLKIIIINKQGQTPLLAPEKSNLWLRELAQQGNADAQFYYGKAHIKHIGDDLPTTSWIAAGIWFRKSAEQGNADAQYYLGYMYANGRGLFTDITQAALWYRKSAEQGNADAQFQLGNMCANGIGMPIDYPQAASWWHKAAEQDNAEAQNFLGVMYTRGLGVKRDYKVADTLLRKAAVYRSPPKQKSQDAENNLKLLKSIHCEVLPGKGGEPSIHKGYDYTDTLDYPNALKMFRPLAQQGNAVAQYELGTMYTFGRCVPKDHAQALAWYHKAAAQGNADAEYHIGYYYENGLGGVGPDKTQAYVWYKKAANGGNQISQQRFAEEKLEKAFKLTVDVLEGFMEEEDRQERELERLRQLSR